MQKAVPIPNEKSTESAQLIVAQMVDALGYDVFLWDMTIGDQQVDIVQVNPMGLWIAVRKDLTVSVGVDMLYGRASEGTSKNLQDPTFTEEWLRETISDWYRSCNPKLIARSV